MSESILKSFHINTLGCKLNQYESECLRARLEKTGLRYSMDGEGADFSIINTCTVTGKTDSRCRNAIRRAKRSSPHSIVIVTGCQVEISPDELKGMDEADYIIPNAQKGRIPVLIERLLGMKSGEIEDPEGFLSDESEPEESLIERFSGHSRAFIKIQNGCDAYCSYCIIPFARGRNRSIEPEKVITQIRKLASNGYQEIILTGIHIGRYGAASSFEVDLAGLLREILNRTDGTRIRLSSIEPNEIGDELIDMAASTDRIAPHFHIPLQSGDDSILQRMNRSYRREEYFEKVQRICERIDGVAIGTDVIVGFPGENERHFENTRTFLESLEPVTYYHVFSYSDRPGTAASEMADKVSPAEKKRRSAALIEIGREKRRRFMRSQIGKDRLAVVLEKINCGNSIYRAITGNYCSLTVKSSPDSIRKVVPVRIIGLDGEELRAELTGKPYFEGNINE